MPTDHLAQELVALQTKLAYQEKALAELSEVLYSQERRLANLESFARVAVPQLRALGIEADPSAPQKPPHY
jgi:SlyX protein